MTRTLLSLAILGLALPASACRPTTPDDDARPVVVVTIHPVADLVARVGGDAVRVVTLLPPRASLHTWEATPGQVRELSAAAGYVTVGGGLDTSLDGFGADRPDLRKLRITDGMALERAEEDHAHGGEDEDATGDPHVWLDPILVRDQVIPRIADFLAQVAPSAAAGIRERASAVEDSLTALDGQIRAILATAPRRDFIATHDAWSYFARRYGLTALGSLYESPGHEPGARGLARLVDAARAAGVSAVLSEPQLAETAALALAGELDVGVVVVDPLGGAGVPERDSYFDLMRSNARAFARALGAQDAS